MGKVYCELICLLLLAFYICQMLTFISPVIITSKKINLFLLSCSTVNFKEDSSELNAL
jgi:hypothetical protein